MATINNDSIPVEQIVRLGEFVETIFLPAVKKNAKPSTAREYQSVWDLHLRALVSRERINLRDFRTAHVQRWLDLIGEGELSRNSLKRIKSMISGCFAEAKRLGYSTGRIPRGIRK